MMRDTIGQNFTTKEVKFGMRKILSQFSKRIDPDLPFYYYTSSHTRYYEGTHPDFDQPPAKSPKEKRLPRREQPAAFGPRRATMPVRGSLAIRPKFHNVHWSFLYHQVDPLFYMNIHMHIQLIIFGNYSVHQHDHESLLRTIIISCQRVLAQA